LNRRCRKQRRFFVTSSTPEAAFSAGGKKRKRPPEGGQVSLMPTSGVVREIYTALLTVLLQLDSISIARKMQFRCAILAVFFNEFAFAALELDQFLLRRLQKAIARCDGQLRVRRHIHPHLDLSSFILNPGTSADVPGHPVT
jgi:hypothetical protein